MSAKILPSLILYLLLFTITPASATDQGEWRALIIGIGNYQDNRVTDLRTPVADGRDLARILSEQYGFQITTLFDNQATWQNIDAALRKLIAESGAEDSILIYYGGHGDLDRELDEGWWYPVDAVPGKRQTYLQNSDLRELIKKMAAKHVLLVSDSCFAGSLFGDYRSFSAKIDDRYHQRLYESKSRQGLTSGGKEPVLDGGSKEHSIFAYHLLKFLRTTDRDIFSVGELFTEIAPVITNNSPQKPLCLPILYTGHEQGEFVFVRSGADIINYVSTAVVSAPVKSGSSGSMRLFWIIGGVVICTLMFTLLLVPRIFSRRRDKALELAVASRDMVELANILKAGSCKNEHLLASARTLTSPAAGLILEGIKQRIVIGPGPRQGIGRGTRWPLAIADPHISRKPHCWLLLSDGSFSINSDGGEIKVNGESLATSSLQKGDSLSLGPVTELLVARVVYGQGIVLRVMAGPEKGKLLVMIGDSAPLNWLTGQEESVGRLSWRQEHPVITVAETDSHPLSTDNDGSDYPLLAGDVLRIGEQDWMVKLL